MLSGFGQTGIEYAWRGILYRDERVLLIVLRSIPWGLGQLRSFYVDRSYESGDFSVPRDGDIIVTFVSRGAYRSSDR